jgi:hypothetical protein
MGAERLKEIHEPMKRLRSEIGAICLLASFVLLAYWKVIFTRGYTYFLGADLGGQYYPWYQFAGWAWKNGFLPLWNPFTGGGELFFVEMQPGAFYPLNLILFLLPSHNGGVDLWMMDLFLVLSVLGAGLGEYFLLRFLKLSRPSSLIGSVIFALGGYTAFVVGHQSILEGVVWLPWIVLVFIKALESCGTNRVRFALACGFLLGMSVLAGHIQPPAHTCLILLFFSIGRLFRKDSARSRMAAAGVLIGTVVCSLAVAAVQLLPSFIYSLSAYRWVAGIRLDPGQRVPFDLQEIFSPAEYLSLIVPSATSHQFYFGIAALFLVLFGALVSRHRYRRMFVLGALLCFLYSWGRVSSLYSASYLFIPFIEKVPESSRSFFMLHFFVAGLAAMGADSLRNPLPAGSRRPFKITANAALILAGTTLSFVLAAAFWHVSHKGALVTDSFVPYGISAALLAMTGGLIFLRKYRMIRLRSFGHALVLLVAFDLTSRVQANTPHRSSESADQVYAETGITAFLKGIPGIFRVADLDGALPLNFGDVYRIQTTGGYGASARKDYHDFLNIRPDSDNAMRMLNVRYYLSKKTIASMRRTYSDEQTGVSVYEDPLALPRIAFVSADGPGNASKVGEYLLQTRQVAGESRIISYEPNEIKAICKGATSGYLWLSELAYPGWKAFVDGREAPIFVSDKIFRTVPVPSGEHSVRLVFRPASVYAGAAISLSAILLMLISSTCLRRPPD